MKHTQGNWIIEKSNPEHQRNGFAYTIYSDVLKDRFLAMVNGVKGNKTCEANAKLIAAAPDLLEAAIQVFNRKDDNRFLALELAIKKATE